VVKSPPLNQRSVFTKHVVVPNGLQGHSPKNVNDDGQSVKMEGSHPQIQLVKEIKGK